MQLAHIFSSVGEAIVATDSQFKISAINPAALSLFGVAHEEAIGASLKRFLPALPLPITGGAKQLERDCAYGHPDREIKQGCLSIAVTQKPGIEMLTWVFRDMTPIRQHEEELTQARHLAEMASLQKSEFLASMSHEIRTTMNGVLGMAAILLDTDLSHDQADYVETIHQSGELLLNVLNDILDFSKIDAGKIGLVSQKFCLREIMEAVIDLSAPQAFNKNLELVCHLPHILGGTFQGDPNRLRQVLLNLVSNAVKFTEAGSVTLHAHQVENKTHQIHFEVVDTGIGIQPQDLQLIFKPFSQVDGSGTRRSGGTGLGLVISNKLIALMGGCLGVESKPDVGSRFYFNLPLEPVQDAMEFPNQLIKPVSVLIVSPEPVFMNALAHQLEYWSVQSQKRQWQECEIESIRRDARQKELVFLDLEQSNILALTSGDGALSIEQTVVVTWLTKNTQRCETADGLVLSRPVRLGDLYRLLTRVKALGPVQKGRSLTTGQDLFTAPLSILVVEDNVINQKVMIRMLHKSGCKVSLAVNGVEAVAAVSNHCFQLVFMDCQMPEMDGYQATRNIRELEHNKSEYTPIIAMTANAYPADRQKCFDCGMDDYLCKPLNKNQLYEILAKWLKP